MINVDEVYKIKYTPLSVKGRIGHMGREEWVNGFNVLPKLGGSGKTFTSKKIVNRMFNDIANNCRGYGVEFECRIVTFKLQEVSVSKKVI